MKDWLVDEEIKEWTSTSDTLLFSCEEVQLEVNLGEVYEGSFTLYSKEETPFQGWVFVNGDRMECITPDLEGSQSIVYFRFLATDLEEAETFTGSFDIVTSLGEYQLPYEVVVKETLWISETMGQVKNLFHFTNLAKSNWEEAENFFFSSDFPKLLVGHDGEYLGLYQGLSRTRKSHNMETFLQQIRKKSPVSFTLSNEQFDIEQVNQFEKQTVEIRRNGWGYTFLTVEVEGGFLSCDRALLENKDFENDTCTLNFYIQKEKLHKGRNLGKIILHSITGDLNIAVSVRTEKNRSPIAMRERELRRLQSTLTKLYVDSRLKKIPTSKWRRDTEMLLEKMRELDDRNLDVKLFRAHLLITQDKKREAKWILDRSRQEVESRDSRIYEAYRCYLEALLGEEELPRETATNTLWDCYYAENGSWKIGWLLLYLSKELKRNPVRKWEFTVELLRNGCTSPVIFLEALQMLNTNPTLLSKLEEVECNILRFGVLKGQLSRELIGVVQYLAGKEKNYKDYLFALLQDIYAIQDDVGILQSMLSLLIKGNKKGKRYFALYQDGVEAELRLTRLYEYYMLSIDKEKLEELPKVVLLYFSYENEPLPQYAAWLYRYVYEHKEELQDIYLHYIGKIERYVIKQLHSGAIDEDLGYLYEQVIVGSLLTEDNAKALTKVLFTYRFSCQDKQAERVIWLQERIQGENSTGLQKGVANLELIDPNYQILLESRDGRRYAPTQYKLEPYMDIASVVQQIGLWIQRNFAFDFYVCAVKEEWLLVNQRNGNRYAYLCKDERLEEREKRKIRIRLMHCYYEQEALEDLEELLTNCQYESVEAADRSEFVQYLVARGFYEKAFHVLQTMGSDKADPRVLAKVASRLLESGEVTPDDTLTSFVYKTFTQGKYDEEILRYLVQYKEGSTRQLRQIYKAAVDFEIDTYALCERILTQILFTGAYIAEEVEIFKTYVTGGAKTKLEQAFLRQCACKYLLEDKPLDGFIMRDMARVKNRGHEITFPEKLAYLKYYAKNLEYMKDAEEGLLQEFLREIVLEKQIYLSYLQIYGNRFAGMEFLLDRTIIEYSGLPSSRVIIHYRRNHKLSKDSIYEHEEMQHIYGNLWAKDFVLFYGEDIQYYITEAEENREQLTQSGVLTKSTEELREKNSRYQLLNDMALSYHLEDMETAGKLLEEYVSLEYLAEQILKR